MSQLIPLLLLCSSPAFLDKMSIHVAKNFLDLPKIKIPLILGIWGKRFTPSACQACAGAAHPLPEDVSVQGGASIGAAEAGLPSTTNLSKSACEALHLYRSAAASLLCLHPAC